MDDCAIAYLSVACFKNTARLDSDIVSKVNPAWLGRFHVYRTSSDMRPFMDEASSANNYAANVRLESRTGVDHGFGKHLDRVCALENRIVRDGKC